MKALANDKIDVTKKIGMCFGKGEKTLGEMGKKCWLPGLSPFPTIFS